MSDFPSPDSPAPTARELLAQLETVARRELAQLSRALPTPAAAVDPLLAHLAWDLGLPGEAVALDGIVGNRTGP